MKKITILTVALIAVLTIGVGTAGAEMSVGFQGMIGQTFNGISLRGWSDAIGYEGTFFYGSAGIDELGDADVWALDLQAMYAIIQKDNSKLYVGADLAFGGWDVEPDRGSGASDNILWFGPLIGAQWSFQGIPELSFNWEVAYDFVTIGTDDIIDDDSLDLDVSGFNTTFGIHYAF